MIKTKNKNKLNLTDIFSLVLLCWMMSSSSNQDITFENTYKKDLYFLKRIFYFDGAAGDLAKLLNVYLD